VGTLKLYREPHSSTEEVLERKAFGYHRKYNAEGVTLEYEVFGEAFFPKPRSSLIRRLTTYEQKEAFGVDKVTISLPRDYLDEDRFSTLRQQAGISKYLFIYSQGDKLYISFQRELFNSTESYLNRVDEVLLSLYYAGVFKFPTFKMSSARGDCVTRFPELDTPKKQVAELFKARKLEELEIFFDQKAEILKYLRLAEDEVHHVGGTIYSNDYEKSPGHVSKSYVKVYNKPEAQKAHYVEPTKLEKENPIRIEFTLPKEMMAYMTLDALDCNAGGIIARVADALVKGICEKASWIHTISEYPALNPVLKGILSAEPKKRLRQSRAFLSTLKRKDEGDIPESIKKQIEQDPLGRETWGEFIRRKKAYDEQRVRQQSTFKKGQMASNRGLDCSLHITWSEGNSYKEPVFNLLASMRRYNHHSSQCRHTQTQKGLRPTLYIKENACGVSVTAFSTGPPRLSVDFIADLHDTC
jgi:hypothetical protein